MPILVFMTIAMIVAGGGSALAQQVRSMAPRNAPPTGMTATPAAPTTPPATGLGAIRAPGASPLGAIQLRPGTAATISAGAVGSITGCPTVGVSAPAPSTAIDPSNAVAMTGALSPQPLPGTTIPVYPFGTTTMTGGCNPAAIAQSTAEFFNNTAVTPIPGLATVTGTTFSNATIPTAATEAGGNGESPQIIVPTPSVPSASPCAGSTTINPTVITDPTTLMSSSTAMAMASVPPSLFGC
jgi:hypothetical protein